MKLLTKEQEESNVNAQIYHICEEKIEKKIFGRYCKVRDHCHYTRVCGGAAHSIYIYIYNSFYSFLKWI